MGIAANAVPDPASLFGFATQTRPFLWEDGVMKDLDTLGGTDGAAFLINDHGQIMGSFTRTVVRRWIPSYGRRTARRWTWGPSAAPTATPGS